MKEVDDSRGFLGKTDLGRRRRLCQGVQGRVQGHRVGKREWIMEWMKGGDEKIK